MEFIQQVINGMSLGAVYALIALGYTMVYGIVKLINFAHGDIIMIGSYVSLFVMSYLGVFSETGVSVSILILAMFISMIVCAIFGIIIEKLCYKPLRNAPRIIALITTIGVSMFLQNGAKVLPAIGPNPKPYPTINGINNIQIYGLNISLVQIMVLIISIALMIILNFIISKTKVGKAMRAVSLDHKAASLMGINTNTIIAFTFAIGAALAASAGVLFSSSYPQLDPYMGIMPGLKAFIAAVFGGIGSIPGAVVGGFLIGIIETLTKGFISTKLADAVVVGVLIIILFVKPEGLLGRNTNEKV